jgi:hypothetical protein
VLFGFWTDDSGATVHAGLFEINDAGDAFESIVDVYDGTQWLNNGQYVFRYDVHGDWNEHIGAGDLAGFNINTDITVLDQATKDLIDVENEVQVKQNKLVPVNNIDINYSDPLNPRISAITVTPDVAVADNQIADAKATAAMIAASQSITRSRGSVVSAYTPLSIYAADVITVNALGSGYQVGDSLQYGLDLKDILIVVATINGQGGILTFTISNSGANTIDLGDIDNAVFLGGHGTGATFDLDFVGAGGSTLADVNDPQPNNTVVVLKDELHNQNIYTWIYSDTNNDGVFNWISLAPSGATRDFLVDPIISNELGVKSVITSKIDDKAVTSTQLDDAVNATLSNVAGKVDKATTVGTEVVTLSTTDNRFRVLANSTADNLFSEMYVDKTHLSLYSCYDLFKEA